MKKFIVLLAVVCISIPSALAQTPPSILVDRVSSEGYRSVVTSEIYCNMFSVGALLYLSLSYIDDQKGSESYSLWVKFKSVTPFRVPKDAVMLIKLDNGDVMELKQWRDSDKTGDTIGTYNKDLNLTIYDIGPAYFISKENLEKFSSNKVVKLRFECSGTPLNAEYDENVVGETISVLYSLIKNALSTKNDIYSDF